MTLNEELIHLRALTHATSVRLDFRTGGQYFEPDFIKACVSAYEKRVLSCLALNEKLNPLEQLAVILLRDSANVSSDPVRDPALFDLLK
jgi:hypothetical protein